MGIKDLLPETNSEPWRGLTDCDLKEQNIAFCRRVQLILEQRSRKGFVGGFMGTKKWKEKTCWQADEWLYVLVRSPNTDSDLERADGELLHKHKTIQLQKETIFKEEIKRNIDFSPPPRETNERSLKAQCLTGYWETLEVGVW